MNFDTSYGYNDEGLSFGQSSSDNGYPGSIKEVGDEEDSWQPHPEKVVDPSGKKKKMKSNSWDIFDWWFPFF